MSKVSKAPISRLDDGTASVDFDSKIYSPEAVKKAAYKFAADFAAILQTDNGIIRTVISFPANANAETQEKLLQAFCNEVLDQDLREIIARETEASRNLILAQAFSKTSLLNED